MVQGRIRDRGHVRRTGRHIGQRLRLAEFLDTLVERCQSSLEVDAGGVMLEDPDGKLRLAAATSEKMQELEEAEIRHGEGPCFTAYRDVEQVVAEDLGEAHERWPRTMPVARALGMTSVYAFPLRLRDDCIGALNLYREQSGPFEEDDVRMARICRKRARSNRVKLQEVAAGVVKDQSPN